VLSVAVHNHYKRIDSRLAADDVELQKSNILLLGPPVVQDASGQNLAKIITSPSPSPTPPP